MAEVVARTTLIAATRPPVGWNWPELGPNLFNAHPLKPPTDNGARKRLAHLGELQYPSLLRKPISPDELEAARIGISIKPRMTNPKENSVRREPTSGSTWDVPGAG